MLPLLLRPDELQLGRGETIEDTARTLSGYAAAIVARTFAQETVERLAAAATVPVINALTDEHHPCQALADLLTLRERFGRLDGLRVAYVGAGNNVATSLVEAGALTGMDVVVACPPGYEPSVAGAHVVTDPLEAVAGADAVYTDVWVSMGEEAEREQRALGVRAVPGRRAAHGRGARRRGLHALPARPPRRGGDRRGHRRAAVGRLAAGREPPPDRGGAPLRARHAALGDLSRSARRRGLYWRMKP